MRNLCETLCLSSLHFEFSNCLSFSDNYLIPLLLSILLSWIFSTNLSNILAKGENTLAQELQCKFTQLVSQMVYESEQQQEYQLEEIKKLIDGLSLQQAEVTSQSTTNKDEFQISFKVPPYMGKNNSVGFSSLQWRWIWHLDHASWVLLWGGWNTSGRLN